MASSSPIGTYIYCIARAEPLVSERKQPLRSQAVGGPEHPTRILSSGDLAAVVSDVPARRLEVRRELLMAHEAVVVETMECTDVIPLSFGAVASNDEAVIERLLQAASDELHAQLDAIRDCVELDLKVLWNRERLFEEIVAENDKIRAWRDTGSSASVNEQIQLGQLTGESIASKSDHEAEVILDVLEPLAVDARPSRLLTDMMVLNFAFLVEKAQLEAFDGEVNNLAASDERRLIFRYAGPVPPYHFVDLSLCWEEDADGSAS